MNDSNPVVLRSAANPKVRRLVRLRDNRSRRRAGRVIVDGWRETAAAIDAKLELCGVYLPESSLIHPESEPDLVKRLVFRSCSEQNLLHPVSDAVMEKIGYGQSHRGVVAEFMIPDRRLDAISLPQDPLLLVLDQIEKPGNLGAIFRSADAAGVDAVLLCESDDLFNPNAIRSSLGSVFHLQSASGSEQQVREFLVRHQIRAVAARVESSKPVWEVDLRGPLAIVLGSEAYGLGKRWNSTSNQPVEGVRIPMLGRIDSLNVSVSAAVLAMEARRQRGQ